MLATSSHCRQADHLHSCSACPLLRSEDAESEKQRRKDLVRAAGRAAVEETLLAPSGSISQSKARSLS